ncbi:hypothetical protein BPAE_0009g00230 [Botrytis paeoniae]|uniref:Peptidase A1 domain-containing protein n=1 Tax=Botrytis paeoniae TaxID=278948 RepID=A0A4Z1G7L7_9HELO|nr:hypothetical protein BPAE_0009g00230 [Botrytis paeoniae]
MHCAIPVRLSTTPSIRVRRGNFFFENESTSYEKEGNMVTVGTATIETAGHGAESGIANLMPTSNADLDIFSSGSTNLVKFPIGIPREAWDHEYTILHAMGMGTDSTYLNRPLGGYDQEKVIGQNYTQALDYSNATGCWTGMKVTISDIELVDRTGSTISIFPPNFALPVCIVPQRQLLIEAPGQSWTPFKTKPILRLQESLTGYIGSLNYMMQPIRDLSIKLSSGLEVTIPNSQFMPPFVTIERNGSRVFNESQKEFLYGVTSNQPSTLGRYFLTAAYLMVNHDENTFTLWQANPSTATDLVPTISKDTVESCANLTTNGTVVVNGTLTTEPGASDTTGSSHPATDAKSEEQTGLSHGALVGIAVGIVSVVAILARVAWCMLRKKKLKQEQRPTEVVYQQPPAFVPDSTFAGFHEVHGTQSKHEMDASRRTYEYGHRDEPVQELP